MTPRSRPWLALVSSGLLHMALGALVMLSTATAASPSEGGSSPWAGGRSTVIPLRGDQTARQPGRDALLEILSAPDGFAVRLTSPDGGEAVGLAWVSPSLGTWLAIDRASSDAGGTVRAWQQVDNRLRMPLANVGLDDGGSGRVVVVQGDVEVTGPGRPVTLQVTGQRGVWPFRRDQVVLHGTGLSR